MKKYSDSKAFTLIEILVTVAIISLLSSIVFASLSAAREKAVYVKAKEELRTVETAVELSRLSNGSYPVQQYLNSPLKTESSFYQEYFSENLPAAPTVSNIISAGEGEQESYVYISNGETATDSEGTDYYCGPDLDSYIVMYRKVLDEDMRLDYVGFDLVSGVVDEYGNSVVRDAPDSPFIFIDQNYGNDYAPSPDPDDIITHGQISDVTCYPDYPEGPTGQEMCIENSEYPEFCNDGCYEYYNTWIDITLPPPSYDLEVGYYICG